jgi:3-oxoacyl-[acyl-carrier-protein] synthase-3
VSNDSPRGAFVDHFSYALGDDTFDLDQAVALKRTLTTAKALRDAGFVQHHVCRDGTNAYDLARRAVSPIADKLGDIGAIIYSTCLPFNGNIGDEAKFRETRDVKHVMDFPVSHLQADFKLDRAAAIGLNQQACTSQIGALRIAKALLADDASIGRILCVTADRFPQGAIYEQAYNLISDGASCCVVSNEPTPSGFRIVSSHHITNGALAQASDDETVGTYFNYTFRLLSEQAKKAGITMDAIDWIVPQNTNAKAWTIIARLLKVDPERVFLESIGDVGHIISSDNVVNMVRLQEKHTLKPGTKLLLFMAGFGLNWQSVILEKT